MKPRDLVEALKKVFKVTTDRDVAKKIGRTGARVGQWQKNNRALTIRQVASVIKDTSVVAEQRALETAIEPIVELYPIESTRSPQDKRWELSPTGKTEHPRNRAIRSYLEKATGIYFFYDSAGKVIYTGKTEKQNLWKEMRFAFNRKRQAHKVYKVKHPVTGSSFEPAYERQRQPRSRIVYLHDTAKYFSAYKVAPDLIGNLEAMIIRSLCNDVSNVKMEKFKFKSW